MRRELGWPGSASFQSNCPSKLKPCVLIIGRVTVALFPEGFLWCDSQWEMILAGNAAVLVYYNKSTSHGNWLEVPEKPWEESHGLACPAEWPSLLAKRVAWPLSCTHSWIAASFILTPAGRLGKGRAPFLEWPVVFSSSRTVPGRYEEADLDEREISKPFSLPSSPSSECPLLDMERKGGRISTVS